MNTLIRWCRFNLVGAMGMAFQLIALALLNRSVPGQYLLVSAAAVELTIVHNFVWHVRYTWRGRRRNSALTSQFVRFQLSNGLVSIFGNLALMQVLVHHAHFSLLLSNSVAILCCSIVNFCLGDRWAFAGRSSFPVSSAI
jgi:putative flippase GtrA